MNKKLRISDKYKEPLWAICLVLLIISAYLPALRGGFIWDDDDWVYENPYVTGEKSIWRVWYTTEIPGQNYPLTYTFFRLQSRLWGLNPFGYHLSNVLLHAVNALLLLSVLRNLKVRGAWFVATVFALHPLMVESVAWITEAKNLLSAFFLFLSLLLFFRFGNTGRKSTYSLSLLLYLLALLSKTFICTFPVILLILRWYRKGRVAGEYVIKILPFFFLSLLAGAFTWFYEVRYVGTRGDDWAMPFPDRILVAGKAFWFYLGKLTLPLKITFIYPHWEVSPGNINQWIFPISAIFILAILWRARNRIGRGPFTALACYSVLLFPALGFVSFYAQIYSFVADHYAYLAVIGPTVIIVATFESIVSSKTSLKLSAGLIAICFFILTFSRAQVYKDSETLFREVIEKNPNSWMAHNNLGQELVNKDRIDEALAHYYEALRYKMDSVRIRNNLGDALIRQREINQALIHLNEALQLNPNYAPAYNNLGLASLEQGKIDEAAGYFLKAVQFRPVLVEAYNNLGIALSKQGELDEAIKYYLQALRLKPDYVEAHYNLGIDLDEQGKPKDAIFHLSEALRIDPDYEEAHNNLGYLLARQGKFEEALHHFNEALRIKPNFPEALRNRRLALEKIREGK